MGSNSLGFTVPRGMHRENAKDFHDHDQIQWPVLKVAKPNYTLCFPPLSKKSGVDRLVNLRSSANDIEELLGMDLVTVVAGALRKSLGDMFSGDASS